MNEMRQSGASKSPTAFRTISEVAAEVGVPQHVLRFWETRFFQLRPLKRAGGRRYYRPEDVAFLHRVRRLLYEEGYTIKGVQKLLRAGSKEAEAGERALSEAAGGEAARPKAVPVADLPDVLEPRPSAGPAPSPAGPRGRLGAEERAALAAIRDELATLRDLLRHERT